MLKEQFHVITMFALTVVFAIIAVRHETQFWQGVLTASFSALCITINPGINSPK